MKTNFNRLMSIVKMSLKCWLLILCVKLTEEEDKASLYHFNALAAIMDAKLETE